jgi:tetratricopeptide (TPR) repeat protein
MVDLTVDPSEYLPLNEAARTMLINIQGMKVSRNKCNAVAQSMLTMKLMDDPKLASFGSSPMQPEPWPELEDLRNQAASAKAVLDNAIPNWLRSIDVDPTASITVDRPGKETKVFPGYTGAPLKTSESCWRKVNDDYKGDFLMVCDVARCSVVVETEEQLARLLMAFVSGDIAGIKVVRLKNRFANPMFTGIRDCLMNVAVTCADGTKHIAEVQLHFAAILALKGECHVYYDFFREFFVGTDGSYKIRLEMFELLGDIPEDQEIEVALQNIVEGGNEKKLVALEELSGESVLNNAELYLVSTKRLASISRIEGGEVYYNWLRMAGNGYRLKGEFGKAREALESCLEGSEVALGQEHKVTLSALHGLGYVLEKMGLYDDALVSYEKCWEGRKRTLGENHPDTLMTLNNMAIAYWYKWEIRKALEMYTQCWEGQRMSIGEDHPDALLTYSNMAMVYSDLEEYDKAIEMYGKVLEGFKRALGGSHPSTLDCIHNMALAHEGKGEYDKAIEMLEVCLEDSKKAMGVDHPDTINKCDSLAGQYCLKGDYVKSLSLYSISYDGFSRVLGEDHPKTKDCKKSLEDVRKKMGPDG